MLESLAQFDLLFYYKYRDGEMAVSFRVISKKEQQSIIQTEHHELSCQMFKTFRFTADNYWRRFSQ